MQHVHNVLPDYVNGKLEAQLQREVADHISVCPECRAEAELIAGTLTIVQSTKNSYPPHGYFTNVLPRVRRRLEHREKFEWFKNPLFARFAAPLVAVIIIVSLMNQIPFGRYDSTNSSLSDAITLDDVADDYVRQPESLSLSTVSVEQLAVSTIPEGVLERQIAEFFMANGTGIGFEEYPGASTDLLLESLSEQEVETLLQRLGERTL